MSKGMLRLVLWLSLVSQPSLARPTVGISEEKLARTRVSATRVDFQVRHDKTAVLHVQTEAKNITASLWENLSLYTEHYTTFITGESGAYEKHLEAEGTEYFVGHVKGKEKQSCAAVSRNGDSIKGSILVDGEWIEFHSGTSGEGVSVRRGALSTSDGDGGVVDHPQRPNMPTIVDARIPVNRTAQPVVKLPKDLVIEVFLVHDEDRMDELGGNCTAAQEEGLEIMNKVSAIMQTAVFGDGVKFFVSLAGQLCAMSSLVSVAPTEQGEHDPTELLFAVNYYRADHIEEMPSHDIMHYLSGKEFAGSTVGLAFVDSACDMTQACDTLQNEQCYSKEELGCCFRSSSSISQRKSSADIGLVIAHELSHQLGSMHDGDGNSCPSRGFLMAPVAPNSADLIPFSDCTKLTFRQRFENETDKSGYHPYGCLANRAAVLSGWPHIHGTTLDPDLGLNSGEPRARFSGWIITLLFIASFFVQ